MEFRLKQSFCIFMFVLYSVFILNYLRRKNDLGEGTDETSFMDKKMK